MEKGYQEEQKWEDKKKSDKENQKGQGPKKLTLDQKLSRLPITLAQLKAGNSSEKLKKWNKTTTIFFVLFKKLDKNNLK